jgi:hypothetical protein
LETGAAPLDRLDRPKEECFLKAPYREEDAPPVYMTLFLLLLLAWDSVVRFWTTAKHKNSK